MSAAATGPSNRRHSTWSNYQGNVTAMKLCLPSLPFHGKQHSHTHATATSSFHCKNGVWLQSWALKRKEQKS